LEINFKRNKDAKVHFVSSPIIPLLKEISSKKDMYFTAFLLKYYHDKDLVCSMHGKNNKTKNNLYWWTSGKGVLRKQVDGSIMVIWKTNCANVQ
jgi:hypothetical protein